jgi:sarcosine oxidase, subunit gamma
VTVPEPAQGQPAYVQPDTLRRRSFVYRKLRERGARFVALNDGAVAADFGAAVEAEVERAKTLALVDLSPLPRTGFKGAGTIEWLTGQGLTIGPDSNRAYSQSDGALAARLAPSEIFLLDGLAGAGALVNRLNQAWSWTEERPRTLIGYPTPRADSHCWFAVTGAQAPAMFAKICGIDLRPHKFAEGQIAQTSVAKLSGIVIRMPAMPVPSFHLLADSASGEYLWDCVVDAMDEFEGAAVGWAALKRLAGVP